MMTNSNCEIVTTRILNFPRQIVYRAWTEPEHLKNWWGPKGFTNTFHEFDLRVDGKWNFIMHGPDHTNYPNESEFVKIVEPELLILNHLSNPVFQIVAEFEKMAAHSTKVIFRMVFGTQEECERLRSYAPEKNEENFDRLETELQKMTVL